MEDIIEGLNRYIENFREVHNIIAKGHLILRSLIEDNSTYKIYKTYTNELWYITDNEKFKVLVTKNTYKVLSGKDNAVNNNILISFIIELIEFIRSESFTNIIQGTYNEITKI